MLLNLGFPCIFQTLFIRLKVPRQYSAVWFTSFRFALQNTRMQPLSLVPEMSKMSPQDILWGLLFLITLSIIFCLLLGWLVRCTRNWTQDLTHAPCSVTELHPQTFLCSSFWDKVIWLWICSVTQRGLGFVIPLHQSSSTTRPCLYINFWGVLWCVHVSIIFR